MRKSLSESRCTAGAFEAMPRSFRDWRGAFFVEGAGHWLPQEQPEQLNALLLRFLAETAD